jgi:ankyrin repeat protein
MGAAGSRVAVLRCRNRDAISFNKTCSWILTWANDGWAADTLGDTPLLLAAGSGRRTVVKLLIERGAEVNAKNHDGQTPLEGAAGSGNPRVVKLLLEHGANIKTRDAKGQTPLHAAGQAGSLENLKLLLAAGARTKVKDREGLTYLAYLASNKSPEIANYIQKNHLADGTRNTPLHYAAYAGEPEAVQLWLERKMDVNGRGELRRTPLHFAAQGCNLKAAQALIEKGARLGTRDLYRKTPAQLAETKAEDHPLKATCQDEKTDRNTEIDMKEIEECGRAKACQETAAFFREQIKGPGKVSAQPGEAQVK